MLPGLVATAGPSTGVQMAGWFEEEDQHDLGLRGPEDAHPDLGSGRSSRPPARTVVLTPGGEISHRPRARRHRLDRVGRPARRHEARPAHAARYYYYPGWHEPGTTAEFGFNKKAYDSLPADLRDVVDHACQSVQVTGLNEYESKNAVALRKLKTRFQEQGRDLVRLPTSTLKELGKLSRPGRQGGESEKTPDGQEGLRLRPDKFETQAERSGASSPKETACRTAPAFAVGTGSPHLDEKGRRPHGSALRLPGDRGPEPPEQPGRRRSAGRRV